MPPSDDDAVKVILARLEAKLEALDEKLDAAIARSVSKDEFRPVRIVVYGLVGTILTFVLYQWLNGHGTIYVP